MTISIQWIKKQKGEGSCFKVPTSFACLIVYRREDVIVKTDWVLDTSTSTMPEGDCLYRQIKNYLDDPLTTLTVTMEKQGTDFRNKVWDEICSIPVGKVRSYTELADNIGSGARAVANACRNNPYPGIIPCHRVVAVNGIGGFMGEKSGKFIEIKKNLLEFEKSVIRRSQGDLTK